MFPAILMTFIRKHSWLNSKSLSLLTREQFTLLQTLSSTDLHYTRRMLVDKLNTGWLAWGKAYRAYAVPQEQSFKWDADSAEALAAIRRRVVSKPFWEAMFKHLSQEHTRDYLA